MRVSDADGVSHCRRIETETPLAHCEMSLCFANTFVAKSFSVVEGEDGGSKED